MSYVCRQPHTFPVVTICQHYEEIIEINKYPFRGHISLQKSSNDRTQREPADVSTNNKSMVQTNNIYNVCD